MKYSILGFNQEAIINYSVECDGKVLTVDLTDLQILNYIMYAHTSAGMQHILEDNIVYTWINHNHLLEDLPILRISEGTLRNRLTKLRRMKLLMSKTIANSAIRGSKTFYATTTTLQEMLYSSTSRKNDMVEGPHHDKMTRSSRPRHDKITSNNEQYIDNKVDNTNTIVLVEDAEAPSQKHPKNNASDFLGSAKRKKQPAPKVSLYSKCIAMVEEYTDDPNLRELLITYLKTRLEMRDKPIYANQWKGLLNKLTKLVAEDTSQSKEDIVQQSIDRGYLSFFPVKQFNSSTYSSGIPRIGDGIRKKATPEEIEAQRKWEEEMRARGEIIDF